MKTLRAEDAEQAYAKHAAWWASYWELSSVRVTKAPPSFNASLVSWQYAINRYLSACEARGPGIVKFNGGIFNVDNIACPKGSSTKFANCLE